MNSNSGISFGSSLNDSLNEHGTSTTTVENLLHPIEKSDEEEDDYDALNDETFGDIGPDEGQLFDWESEHEKLARLTLSDGGRPQTNPDEEKEGVVFNKKGLNINTPSLSSRDIHGLSPIKLPSTPNSALGCHLIENSLSAFRLQENDSTSNQSIFHDPAIVNLLQQQQQQQPVKPVQQPQHQQSSRCESNTTDYNLTGHRNYPHSSQLANYPFGYPLITKSTSDIWSSNHPSNSSSDKPYAPTTIAQNVSGINGADSLLTSQKMKTLQEIEQDLFSNAIKRPIRVEDLEASLLADNNVNQRKWTEMNQLAQSNSVDVMREAFERNSYMSQDPTGWNLFGRVNIAQKGENHNNNGVRAGGVIQNSLLNRESPWKPTEQELLKAASKSCAELEKDLLARSSPSVDTKSETEDKQLQKHELAKGTPTKSLDKSSEQHQQAQQRQVPLPLPMQAGQMQQQRPSFGPWGPMMPPPMVGPDGTPLMPMHMARGFPLMRPPFPPQAGGPFMGRPGMPSMGSFPMPPHPYGNNMRFPPGMFNPLQRMPPPRHMMPPHGTDHMIRPRPFVPHPLLHPHFHPGLIMQQQQLQQQQQYFKMLQQRNQMSGLHNRNRPPSRNGFNGLMTQREKDWLIKIQLTQLEFGDPYVEDYYFVQMTSKKLAMKTKSNPKDSKDKNSETALILPERGKDPKTGSNYVPRQFEGSLGKISVSNINCPRKLLDYSKKEGSLDGELGRPSTPAGRMELKRFRQLLLSIEKLYLTLLSIDDEDKRILALPEEARIPHVEKRKELCNTLFEGITDDTNEHINHKVASIRKGCSLIFRSLTMFRDVKQKTIIIGELLNVDNFPLVVTQKDQTIYGLNYGEILIDCIKTIKDCDFSHLLHIANCLNDISTVAKYQCGEEIILTLIEQGTFFNMNDEEKSKWSTFVKFVLTEVEDIAHLRSFCNEHLAKLAE